MAARLKGLLPEIVFVGGCTTGLLITDPAASPVRVTDDVDVATNRSLNDFHTSRPVAPVIESRRRRTFSGDQSGKSRLGRSSSPWNEPRDARLHNRIEPDSYTDTFTNFLDGVIGKSRDFQIFPDVEGACSCG